ncbi:hypothetical protein HAV15_000341 [Penicillium sp. str. |nr:hypothetical protein HAV15_000341 [Penicillium sp. str. \
MPARNPPVSTSPSSRPRPPHLPSGPSGIHGLASTEAWRYTGPFSRAKRFRGLFPGFGIASVAFAAYCTYEHFFLKDDHHHGDAHHGDGHH